MVKKRIIVTAIVAALTAGLCGCSLFNTKDSENSSDKINIETESTSEDASVNQGALLEDENVTSKIDEINAYIDNYFYFDIDREDQEEALYDGIMAGLDDPYSVYYTKEEYDALKEDTSGEYVGIGAVVTQDADMLVSIVRPIPGSPAEEAGLLAGDIIVEVDGVDIVDQDLTQVVEMIRGEENTSAHITIYREGETDYLEFDITRRVVENVTVDSSMLDNNIGYIQVTQFCDNTSDEFKEAIEDLLSQGAIGLIIDMRDNPGGVLDGVVDMCDYILDDGVIVTTKDKYGRILQEFEAGDEHSLDIPMVVLTNGNSASAAEIFSGAMQDTGKAKLVGTTTFGKGIVQSVIPLSDGTAIKITVAKYFTPNGNDIHEIGIVPDYEVQLPDGRLNAVNLEYEDDLQLQKGEELILEMAGSR
ncbi:MAG: S41 family peptidase [Wujia sp.]